MAMSESDTTQAAPTLVLLRCPFCGGAAVVDSGGANKNGGRVGFAFVRCADCHVEQGAITGADDGQDALAEATRLWNRRVQP